MPGGSGEAADERPGPLPGRRDGEGEARAAAAPRGGQPATDRRGVRCPFCGSADTALESAFGSTLGFAQYWCRGCRTAFEYLKWEDERPAG